MAKRTDLFDNSEELIEVYSRDDLISEMYVDYSKQTIRIVNHSENWIILPFGKNLKPSWSDYQYMLSCRVFPRERGNCKLLLKIYGLDVYDPDAICRKTHGVMNDDYVWFKYPVRR